ncbi:hypothetical protein [Thermococcus sp. 9N3]|uniref:hypothetical protein n=1 Tax=Thermococcus sp. 9N3 TaxID=163002 RepID=UPI001431B6DF|nr:hypothetical protein [Thermococcus sp. 9N3]NJE50072.1 hypothetical protein [Thermococcus sp. 9N3]
MVEEEASRIIEEEDGVLVVKHVYSIEWTISTPTGKAFHVSIAHEDPEKAKAMALELFEKSKAFLEGGGHGAYSV